MFIRMCILNISADTIHILSYVIYVTSAISSTSSGGQCRDQFPNFNKHGDGWGGRTRVVTKTEAKEVFCACMKWHHIDVCNFSPFCKTALQKVFQFLFCDSRDSVYRLVTFVYSTPTIGIAPYCMHPQAFRNELYSYPSLTLSRNGSCFS